MSTFAGSYPDLVNTKLVDKFYTSNNLNLFWFNTTIDLRRELLEIISHAAYYGLDKNKYHISQLKEAIVYTGSDSNTIKRFDRVYTDAFISFSKDLYVGNHIDDLLNFDELSSKYTTRDNEYLLTKIISVKTGSDIDSIIKHLEPADYFYTRIKSELKNQIELKNVSKVKQLNTTIDLYRWVQHFAFEKYMLINIGSATFGYYENDAIKLTSNIVVGKLSTKTPRFAAYCDKVILYPYWNVPRSIAVKELLPKFKRSPARVDAMNMQIINSKGKIVNPYAVKWSQYNRSNFPYVFRQCTGCDNSLGVIKFNLTDPFDVYLHDTNAKNLFRSKYRFYSHGCIRLEKAIDLGNILLKDKLDDKYLTSCYKDQIPKEHKLEKPIPVFVIYSTVEMDSTGAFHYDKDVYNLMK